MTEPGGGIRYGLRNLLDLLRDPQIVARLRSAQAAASPLDAGDSGEGWGSLMAGQRSDTGLRGKPVTRSPNVLDFDFQDFLNKTGMARSPFGYEPPAAGPTPRPTPPPSEERVSGLQDLRGMLPSWAGGPPSEPMVGPPAPPMPARGGAGAGWSSLLPSWAGGPATSPPPGAPGAPPGPPPVPPGAPPGPPGPMMGPTDVSMGPLAPGPGVGPTDASMGGGPLPGPAAGLPPPSPSGAPRRPRPVMGPRDALMGPPEQPPPPLFMGSPMDEGINPGARAAMLQAFPPGNAGPTGGMSPAARASMLQIFPPEQQAMAAQSPFAPKSIEDPFESYFSSEALAKRLAQEKRDARTQMLLQAGAALLGAEDLSSGLGAAAGAIGKEQGALAKTQRELPLEYAKGRFDIARTRAEDLRAENEDLRQKNEDMRRQLEAEHQQRMYGGEETIGQQKVKVGEHELARLPILDQLDQAELEAKRKGLDAVAQSINESKQRIQGSQQKLGPEIDVLKSQAEENRARTGYLKAGGGAGGRVTGKLTEAQAAAAGPKIDKAYEASDWYDPNATPDKVRAIKLWMKLQDYGGVDDDSALRMGTDFKAAKDLKDEFEATGGNVSPGTKAILAKSMLLTELYNLLVQGGPSTPPLQ